MKTKHLSLQDWNDTYELDVTPKVSISIARGRSLKLPKEFKIGDRAEYDSYNLSYVGNITSITEKTVTIEAYQGTPNAKRHRLSLVAFCWRNWNFDTEEIARKNSDTMNYI
jgi:hypothetical protein